MSASKEVHVTNFSFSSTEESASAYRIQDPVGYEPINPFVQNAWFGGQTEPLALAQEATDVLQGSGGRLDLNLLWSLSQNALDFISLSENSGTLLEGASRFPWDRVAEMLADMLPQTSFVPEAIDLFVLGCGITADSRQLIHHLLTRTSIRSIHVHLFDKSAALLSHGHRQLQERFAKEPGVAMTSLFQALPLHQEPSLLKNLLHTHRLPVVLMTNGAFGMLEDEMDFVRNQLAVFPAQTLFLFDATKIYGPGQHIKALYQLDPWVGETSPNRKQLESLLSKILLRHRTDARSLMFHPTVDRSSCTLAGSYGLELRVRVNQRVQFFVPCGRRYEMDSVIKAFAKEQWHHTERFVGTQEGHGLYVFRNQTSHASSILHKNAPTTKVPDAMKQLPLVMQSTHSFGPQTLLPTSPLSLDVPTNAWLAPGFDPTQQVQALANLLQTSGGLIDPMYLYAEEMGALDALSYLAKERDDVQQDDMPLERVVDQIAAQCDHPKAAWEGIDVISLGCGTADRDIQLIRLLQSRAGLQNIHLHLFDSSLPLLQRAHRQATQILGNHPRMRVSAIAGNFHQLHRYGNLLPNLTTSNRLRIVTLFGDTFGMLANELQFVRNQMHLFDARTLWILDVGLAYAPCDQPDDIVSTDPMLNKQQLVWHRALQPWIGGLIHRHRPQTKQIEWSGTLHIKTACFPSSYSINANAIIDKTTSFVAMQNTRYEEAPLLYALDREGWLAVDGWFYSNGNRLLQILEKK